MGIEVEPLLDAIDRYIEKADDDLEAALTAEGYAGAAAAVEAINRLEESIGNILGEDADVFLERIQEAVGVDDFIENVWPGIRSSDDMKDALYEMFREQFDDMMHSFTMNWLVAENPERIIPNDGRITKPAEDFIRGWSDELARIMNLTTKDSMECILLDAQENGWSVDEVSEAIANSGIRQYGYRSRRVALTETLRVESYAQQEGMIQNPLAYGKKWKHVMNAHPRENHQAIDGQEVFKRETFTLVGADGGVYHPICPRDTKLPAKETINCHCLMETVQDKNTLGMEDDEWISLRNKYMDEIDAEYEAWEEKFKEDYGIEEPRDDPSVSWEMYNSYYEAYRKGEI